MLDRLPVAARGELLAPDDFGDRRDRRDQETARARGGEEIRLRPRAREVGDEVLQPVELRKRLLAAQAQLEVVLPVLVAGGDVTAAFVVHPLHQPAREASDRGAEHERDRHVTVARGKDEPQLDRPDGGAAADALRLAPADCRGEASRLPRERDRLLRGDVDALPWPGAVARSEEHTSELQSR